MEHFEYSRDKERFRRILKAIDADLGSSQRLLDDVQGHLSAARPIIERGVLERFRDEPHREIRKKDAIAKLWSVLQSIDKYAYYFEKFKEYHYPEAIFLYTPLQAFVSQDSDSPRPVNLMELNYQLHGLYEFYFRPKGTEPDMVAKLALTFLFHDREITADLATFDAYAPNDNVLTVSYRGYLCSRGEQLYLILRSMFDDGMAFVHLTLPPLSKSRQNNFMYGAMFMISNNIPQPSFDVYCVRPDDTNNIKFGFFKKDDIGNKQVVSFLF